VLVARAAVAGPRVAAAAKAKAPVPMRSRCTCEFVARDTPRPAALKAPKTLALVASGARAMVGCDDAARPPPRSPSGERCALRSAWSARERVRMAVVVDAAARSARL
jgi:hypothetical protein